MKTVMARREALRHLAVFSAAAVVPGFLSAGCSRKLSCDDVSGLSPADQTVRRETAAYVEAAPDAAKKCSNCAQFEAKAPGACGGCKVVKGPINPDGWCKLWVVKPA
jgi:hypothetical protein